MDHEFSTDTNEQDELKACNAVSVRVDQSSLPIQADLFQKPDRDEKKGVTILGPDVRSSQVHWSGFKNEIRVGLMAIKNLGRATMNRIVIERAKSIFAPGPSTSTASPGICHAGVFTVLSSHDSGKGKI